MPNAAVHWLIEAFGSASFASGMIGTLVGGAIGLAGQKLTIAETRNHRAADQRAKQTASCCALLLKLVQISSHIIRGVELFENYYKEAQERGDDLDQPWAFCREVANPHYQIAFEAHELSVLMELEEFDAFNKCASLDNACNNFSALLDVFNRKRIRLTDLITPKTFDSATGTAQSQFSNEEVLKITPYVFECNALVKAIIGSRESGERAKVAAIVVVDVLERRLNKKMNLDYASPATEAAGPMASGRPGDHVV